MKISLTFLYNLQGYITSRNSPRTLILSFICNLFVLIWGYS